MTIYRYDFPNSTMFASCEYDSQEKELSVEFKTGRSYTYKDVEKQTYDDLIEAKSAGQYFNSIKSKLVQK